MNKPKLCTICKHYGIETPSEMRDDLERNIIYDEFGKMVSIQLCRKHAVDLFKSGQKKFLLSHYRILIDLVGSDELKFLDVLEKTVQRNPSKIF